MRYIALLRGINVGGKRKILMADLRALLEVMGYSNVKTYIQSGNVFFDYDKKQAHIELENQLHQAVKEKYGFDVPTIVRTREEIEKAISNNPYLKGNDVHINQLHLTFLKEEPEEEHIKKAKQAEYAPDDFEVIGKEVFIRYKGKQYTSKLNNKFFEQKLNVRATNRNWKTVKKLLELSE